MKVIYRDTTRTVRTTYRLAIDDSYVKNLNDYIRNKLVNPEDMPQGGLTSDQIADYWKNYEESDAPAIQVTGWKNDTYQTTLPNFVHDCVEDDIWDCWYDDDTIDESDYEDEILDY